MKGVITGREVLSNLWVIWREFGTGCLVRCFWACVNGRRATFLDLAVRPRVR
jgi:Mg/Co/Ni transporter MgtE